MNSYVCFRLITKKKEKKTKKLGITHLQQSDWHEFQSTPLEMLYIFLKDEPWSAAQISSWHHTAR